VLSHTHKQGHEFIFKIADSAWSKVCATTDSHFKSTHGIAQLISLEAPAAETEVVVVSQRQKSEEFHLGLSWSEGQGKYKLSKVITIAPRFLIKNQLSEAIVFREHGVTPRDRSIVEPGQRCAFQVLRSGEEKLLTLAYPGLNAKW